MFVLTLLALLALPFGASAHEVYVLSPEEVSRGISAVSPNPFSIVATHQYEFALWGFLAVLLISTVFAISVTRRIEDFFSPVLAKLKPWAPLVARMTLGLALVASAYFGALIGPELGFSEASAPLMRGALYLSGAFILLGLITRAGAA